MGRVVDAYAKRSKDGGAGLRVELRRTACVFAVGALASGVRVSCFSRALQKALRRLRADVFDAALRRKAAFFVLGEQSGDDRLDADAVATAVERDASVALAVCTEQLQNAFRYASSLFNGGSQLFALCPGLAGELLTCVPVLAVLVRGASKSVAKRGAGAEHAEKALAVKARDLARSDRAHSVKLAGGDAVEAARFAELADAALHAGVAHGVARGALQGVLDVVGKLTVLGVASLLLSSGSRVVDAVTYGSAPVVDANVEAAAEAAVAGGFIRELDGAFLAEIGATGDRLSGGQRSRLSVARARGAATFWLLDEPTAALDAKTEAAVLDNVLGLAKARGVTVLLVAHSKAAVAKCDFASVLAGGAVVETGTVAVLAQDPKSKLAAALAAE
ncbi:ATPase [Aureococcus anophagefferens]|nr:ATPase [Aureococcus anophagefferens]